MKKRNICILMTVLALGVFAGCGSAATETDTASSSASETASSSASETALSTDTASESTVTEEAGSLSSAAESGDTLEGLRTLGDAFALQGKDEDTEQRATYEDQYIYVFSIDGVPYRVIADLPAEISEKLFALEFDEDYDKNEKELVSGLEINKVENLNEQILPQEELDALVGKTGQELFDAGWRSGSFYNTETLEVSLEYGPFAYTMHFDGEVSPEEAEDFDVYEGLADKKVLDAAFEGLGDAASME